MAKELAALEQNYTWELTELPVGKRAIGCRWVYKTKLKQDGSIDRYKARLVAKGYTQIEGVDYFDSFSPVAKTVMVRIFIAVATAHATPLPAGIKFDASSGSTLASPDRYRHMVGRLLYFSFSRPDISFTVQQLSQLIQYPRQPHWEATLHLVRYLKGTPMLGLFFEVGSSFKLSADSDSDWASCIDTRRSVTGYYIFGWF
ncbi:UNVERIFIED_CONTAM: Retrovirus-related Pol polyprotein from transposon RE2 [Sesamum calycinum]|uniref:Retrovirus-related Pol polyprotein from transposon RE2 n=1 Tax=Sesamum calycinum TaxID=2727403 RepID=A0AAW2J9X9_9LAMI